MEERFVCDTAHPKFVHEDRESARNRNHGALLRVLPAACGKDQSVSSQIRVGTEGPQDVVGTADQKTTYERVARLGDPQLRRGVAGVMLTWGESEKGADAPARREPRRIAHREHERKGRDGTNSLDRLQKPTRRSARGALMNEPIVLVNLDR